MPIAIAAPYPVEAGANKLTVGPGVPHGTNPMRSIWQHCLRPMDPHERVSRVRSVHARVNRRTPNARSGSYLYALVRLAVVSLLLESVPAMAQGIDFDKTQILTESLAPHFYALRGSPHTDPLHPDAAGGCIGIFVGSDGVLMVDASYPQLSNKILDVIRRITPSPIKYLVNTHAHRDHVSGNPQFAKLGAVIFARDEARERMDGPQPPEDMVSTTDPERLPAITYGLRDPVKIHMGSETVDLIPVAGAHTDGDTIIRFENSDIVMTGDVYRSYGYPFIDVSTGGTVAGTIDALEKLLRIGGPETTFVPGHGVVVRREAIAAQRDMVLDVVTRAKTMISKGMTHGDILKAKLTASYDTKVPGGLDKLPGGTMTTADRFVDAVYSELQAKH
ncbi:cyclase [Bradyrhizobium japonicum]